MSRKQNAWRNVIWGSLNRGIKLLAPFLLRTLIIHEIGIEYLGLDGLFISILQILNMAELGFSTAIVFSMYKPIAVGDTQTICSLLSFYRKVYHMIGLSILILGIAIIPFLPKLIAGKVPDNINIYYVYTFYLLNTVLGYFLFAYKNSLLIAHQRNDIISNVDSLLRIVQYILQVALVLVFKNYYAYIISLPFFTILNNIIIQYITTKFYPNYICRGTIDHEDYIDIRKRVIGLMIYKLCGVSRNGFDNMFLSAYLGLATVAVYNNYFLILTGIRSIMGIVSSAANAGVGNSIAIETVEKNYGDFCLFDYIYMMLSGGFAVCLIVLYQPFMQLWLGEQYLLPFPIVIAFCAYFYILTMGDVRAIYNDSAGLWWEQRFRTILEAIVNIVLNFIFIQVLGILGVVLASITSLFLFGFIASSYITFDNYFGHSRLRHYFISQSLYAASTFACCVASYYFCLNLPVTGIVGIILKGIICLGISLLSILLFYSRNSMFLQARRFFIESIYALRK